MVLTMKERQAVTGQMAGEYRRATKKEKGKMLDTLIKLTGYNRSYAARVLRQRAKPVVLGRTVVDGVKVTLVEDERTKPRKKPRNRPRKYGKDVLIAPQKVWVICEGICGKRFAPCLKEIVPKLEHLGELTLDEETRSKLIEISPATIDRMLASLQKHYQLRVRSQTKPETLLKHQIPIRTFSDWDGLRPGFIEIDLVSHEGGNIRGGLRVHPGLDQCVYRLDRDRGGEEPSREVDLCRKVRKKYDRARTPNQRVLESDGGVPNQVKKGLEETYAMLNPVKLGPEISPLQEQIDALVRSKIDAQEGVNLEYISTWGNERSFEYIPT